MNTTVRADELDQSCTGRRKRGVELSDERSLIVEARTAQEQFSFAINDLEGDMELVAPMALTNPDSSLILMLHLLVHHTSTRTGGPTPIR